MRTGLVDRLAYFYSKPLFRPRDLPGSRPLGAADRYILPGPSPGISSPSPVCDAAALTMGESKNSRGTEIFGSPRQHLDETEAESALPDGHVATHLPEEPRPFAPAFSRSTLDLPQLPAADDVASAVSIPEPASRVPGYVLEEVSQMVREALAKFGVPGTLEVTAQEVRLMTPQGQRRVPIDLWVSRWPTLDNDSRRERTGEVARRLAEGRRASPLPLQRPQIVLDPRVLFAAAVVIGLLVFFYVDARRHSGSATPLGSNGDPHLDSQPTSGPVITRERETTGRQDSVARDSLVCAATYARVVQGGSVGLTDTDGWLVELALLKQGGTEPLATHPALAQFVEAPEKKSGSRYIWPQEKLSELEGSRDLVVVSPLEVGAARAQQIPGVVLTFSGSLVDAYFDEPTRSKYFHLAHELASALQATHAAVYARCFDDDVHALGSWFMGADSGGASAALLYFMGTYARPLHIALPFARPPGETELNRLHAFKNIAESTARLDRASLATLLGSQGGMATGKRDAPVVIHFPFRDGNRAARASRSIARVTSLSE